MIRLLGVSGWGTHTMRSATIVLVMAALVVAACGPAVRYEYNKPGATAEQRQRDESECTQQAMLTVGGGYGYGSGSAHQTLDQGRLNRCMTSRGYEVQEVKN